MTARKVAAIRRHAVGGEVRKVQVRVLAGCRFGGNVGLALGPQGPRRRKTQGPQLERLLKREGSVAAMVSRAGSNRPQDHDRPERRPGERHPRTNVTGRRDGHVTGCIWRVAWQRASPLPEASQRVRFPPRSFPRERLALRWKPAAVANAHGNGVTGRRDGPLDRAQWCAAADTGFFPFPGRLRTFDSSPGRSHRMVHRNPQPGVLPERNDHVPCRHRANQVSRPGCIAG